MKNLLLFLLIVILILSKDNQCFAQSFNSQNEVDSINKIITSENVADTSLAQAYLLLSELTTEEGLDTMISLCSQVELIVLKGLKTPNKKIKNSLLSSLAGAYNNIGYTHYHQGEIVLSLEYYHKSLTIYEKLNSERGVADCYTNLGNIYTKQQNYKKAIDFFSKSLIIYEAVDYKIGVATCLNNLGGIYNNMKKFDKALTFYNRSLKILTELNVKNGVAATLNNIGTIYRAQNKNIQALEYYNKSLVILEELGNKKGLAYSLKNIAAIMYLQKNLKDANDYAKRSLMISTKIGYPENIKNAASLLSKIYQKQGNYKEALAMRNLEIQMRDSLNNESTQKAAAQQQAKYEYEKQKTIDDAAHDKQIALEQEEQKKQRIISISIAIGLLLVVIFLLFVFNRLRITRKQKIVIEQQHDEVEEAHKEIRDSINYAERIQRSFLATDELLNNNLKDYFVFFQPKDVVSGDFYWAGKLANNQFALINADSTGHGVPGAIMSILNISSLEKAIDQKLINPAEIFNHTRDTIIERLSKDGSKEGGKDGMDASIIAFDFENNKFTYAAAQNPIWVIRNNELIEIKAEKMPIGKHENDSTPFVGGEFEIQKGDVVYTITDGFQDQFGGEKGKKFKVKPFKDYLISIAHLPMHEQREKLHTTFTTWKGNEEQVDDVCVIGVRV